MSIVPFLVIGISFIVLSFGIPFVAGAIDIVREEKRNANLSRKEESHE